MILPYLNYCLLTWGSANKTFLDRIVILQKRAIRIICSANMRSHTDHLFLDNNILKIYDLYSFQLGQFMFNYNKNDLPSIFNNMFSKNQSVHTYPTRHCTEFHLPLLRTHFAQSTFYFEGPKFWNNLNSDIINSPSIYSFKRKLKQFLLQSYTPA